MRLANYACKRALLNDEVIAFLEQNAQVIGESEFKDYIFMPDSGKLDTDKEMKWIRYMIKTVRPDTNSGKFYPYYKQNITWNDGFQRFNMPIGVPARECSSLDEAKMILGCKSDYIFSFIKKTREYRYDNMFIYIEKVEGIKATIEIVCYDERNDLEKNIIVINSFMQKHNITHAVVNQTATLVKKVKEHAF